MTKNSAMIADRKEWRRIVGTSTLQPE